MPTAASKRAKVQKVDSLEIRIAKHVRARELGSRHYGLADRVLATLLEELTETCSECGGVKLKSKNPIPLPGGKKVRLKDIYAEKNKDGLYKAFRAHGIGRYELEISEAE